MASSRIVLKILHFNYLVTWSNGSFPWNFFFAKEATHTLLEVCKTVSRFFTLKSNSRPALRFATTGHMTTSQSLVTSFETVLLLIKQHIKTSFYSLGLSAAFLSMITTESFNPYLFGPETITLLLLVCMITLSSTYLNSASW